MHVSQGLDAGMGGQRHLLPKWPGRIAQPLDLNLRPGWPARGPGGEGNRKVTDVQQIDGVVVAAVGALPQANDVVTLLGHRGGKHRILAEERMVVAGGYHEALGVNDLEMGIEHLLVESDGIHRSRDPPACGEPDLEAVDVLRLDHTRNGRRQRHLLGGGEVVVRLNLGPLGEDADPERPQLREPVFRADPEAMRPGRAICRQP